MKRPKDPVPPPGRPTVNEQERTRLPVVSFRVDAVTQEAIDILAADIDGSTVGRRRSSAIRRAVLEAAERLRLRTGRA